MGQPGVAHRRAPGLYRRAFAHHHEPGGLDSQRPRAPLPRGMFLNVLAGLWFFSALFAYLSVKIVHLLDKIWHLFRAAPKASDPDAPELDLPVDPSRRYFFKTATAAA